MAGTVLLLQGSGERGGAERQLAALARALPDAGWSPVVAVLADGPFVDELRAVPGTQVLPLKTTPRLRDPAAVRRTVARLELVVRDVAPDVVQGTGEKMSLLAAAAGRRAGVPSVAWLHDAPATWREPAGAAAQVALRLARPTSVVAVSRWMADAFRRRYRVIAGVVHNGIDITALPRPGGGRDLLVAETGFPPDAVIAVHAGRLQRWKGADVVLRAMAVLRDTPLHLAVVGGSLFGREQAWAHELEALAGELGVAGRVRFLGHRDDALELMSGADVVVHASRHPEPFGMVVLEGMALGRCVVATRTGGPEELLEHGRTGLLVAPGDPDALAGALRDAADAGLRAGLGADARQRAVSAFTIERTAEAFAGAWSRLARV